MSPKGQSSANRELTESLKYCLLTYGLGKMAEPLRLLEKWLKNPPTGQPVTIICHDGQIRQSVEEILKSKDIQYVLSDSTEGAGAESRATLTIPPLSQRMEDLPLITDFLISQYIDNHDADPPAKLTKLHLASFFFLCYKYNSCAGISTPALTFDDYTRFIKYCMQHKIFDLPANDILEFEIVNDWNVKEKKRVLRLFWPLNVILSNKWHLLTKKTLNKIADYYYQLEDGEIQSSKIVGPGKKYDFSEGYRKLEYEGEKVCLSSIASGDFRHFLHPRKTHSHWYKDVKKKRLLKNWITPTFVFKELQSQWITLLGSQPLNQIISDDINSRLNPILNIYRKHFDSKTNLQSHKPTSKQYKDGTEKPLKVVAKINGKTKLMIFESDCSVVYKSNKYCLPNKHYSAVVLIANEHKKGNPWVRKETIYNECDIGAPSYQTMSVRNWFMKARGDARKFAEDGLIETGDNATCRIPINPDLIVIEYDSE